MAYEEHPFDEILYQTMYAKSVLAALSLSFDSKESELTADTIKNCVTVIDEQLSQIEKAGEQLSDSSVWSLKKVALDNLIPDEIAA